MRATELSITFEDDEHHEFVERYEGDDAELLRSIMHIATIREIRPTFVGPVLRKVTALRGRIIRVCDDAEESYLAAEHLDQGGDVASFVPESLTADDKKTRADDGTGDYVGPVCDWRITVEAVRVTEKGEAQ